jgi:hypothetical protein
MRAMILLAASVLLGGCGTNGDLGNSFVSKVQGFSAAIAAQDNLEVDLLKDFVRKSEQLNFISYGTYTCGDPKDAYIIEAETAYFSSNRRFVPNGYSVLLKARQDLRTKMTILATLASYGEIISGIAQGYKNFDTSLTKAKSLIATVKPVAVDPEAAALLTGLSGVIDIVQAIEKYTVETAIRAAAFKMKEPLLKTVKALNDKKMLLSLVGPESLAFSYWDSCAQERLRFMRDYFPPLAVAEPRRSMILTTHLNGMQRTSVMDFAREYGSYLNERETFIGRRPDYVGLLKQIADANKALTTMSAGDLVDTANNIGTLANTIVNTSNSLSKLNI